MHEEEGGAVIIFCLQLHKSIILIILSDRCIRNIIIVAEVGSLSARAKMATILISRPNSVYVRVSNFRPSPNFSAKALRAFAQLLPPCIHYLEVRGRRIFQFILYQRVLTFFFQRRRYWKLHPKWLGSIDSVEFN